MQIQQASPASAAPLQAGASYAEPFDLLSACHERVERSLALLQRLCGHLAEQGPDIAARSAAADLLRYFDIAAPLHHQDEELHVFPALEAGEDATLIAACATLRAEHRRIASLWQPLRPLLQALAQGAEPAPVDPARLATLAQAFVELHRQHLISENEEVFPAAHARLDSAARQAMGVEMAARRGLDLMRNKT